MIRFSGPGKYRLANGQIVNLDAGMRCKESDGISSRNGTVGAWMWNSDGSICGGSLDSTKLYLAEKILDKKYYAHKNGFADTTAYVIRNGETYHTMRKNGTSGITGRWECSNDRFIEEGSWVEITEGDAHKLLGANAPKEDALKRVTGTKSAARATDNSMFIKKEEVTMEKATAIKVATGVAKFAGKWGWRTVNYWAFEPATEVVTKVMRAVRYVTLTGAIVGGVYAYNNPEKATDLIKSCLPKITIESPEIMKG